jgi:flavorubredoxin
MGQPFEAIKITDRVYWVGAVDWEIRDFHGYSTGRGTTYNAYLVLADKITLIDTVKAPFVDQLLSRIASVVDPRDIDLVVSNHSEMDHSGSLPRMVASIEPEKVFASQMGQKALAQHFHDGPAVTAVKDGESLSLGNMSLTFIETRMVHWPDSMMSYLGEEELLFSQDGFGMHLASSEMFDDRIDDCVLDWEAAKYYANILMPFSPIVAKVLAKIAGLNLSLKIVAPDHGPIWRKGIGRIIDAYGRWAEQKPNRKVVIIYDTMWGSTAKMAHVIADAVGAAGGLPRVLKLRASDRSEVATEVLESGALVVGTPTMNNHMFPTIADVLYYLKGLKPGNLVGAAFGSYGWSGEGTSQVAAILTAMGVDLVHDSDKPVRSQYVPTDEVLDECRTLAKRVCERLT